VGHCGARRHAATNCRSLHREIVQACAKPRLREAFLQQAAIAVTSSPEEMTRHLEREIAVWRDVIARAKVTVQ
jgi:tripartite-type tricarboxylate transporter receptor subunit TctC